MPPDERAGLSAGPSAATDDATTWYLILHPPRRLWVPCCRCHFSGLNELNQLRRAGWRESATTPRRYLCPECSAVEP